MSRPAQSSRALVALFALPLLAILLAALLATPAHAQWGCSSARRGTHISISERDERRGLLIADGERCLEVRSVGAVEFTDDDADVRRLAPGGTLTIEETRGGVTRRVEYAERDGRIERRYLQDGRVRDEADGAAWMRTILPQVARESHIGAEARAARVLRQRGVAGILDEVRQIASGTVKRIYLAAALEQGRPSDDELRAIVRAAERHLSSDSDRGQVLRAVAERRGVDAGTLATVIEAARSISSDSEKARVLAAALAAPSAGVEARTAAAGVARTISSDRAKAGLLAALAPGATASDVMRAEWLRGARTISSDSERRRVLMAALESPTQGEALLTAPGARDALFDVVDGISSDRERGTVLRAIVRRDRLPQPALLAALRSAGRIASDREKAEVLVTAAARRDALGDEEVRRTFLRTTREISSSSEYRRVMDAVIR